MKKFRRQLVWTLLLNLFHVAIFALIILGAQSAGNCLPSDLPADGTYNPCLLGEEDFSE